MATLFEMLQQKQAPSPQYGGNALLADTADAARAMPQQPLMRPTAERQRSRGPGLLDTIWGVAAGYSPNATRQMYDQQQVQAEAARRQADLMRETEGFARSQGPQALAAFATNHQKYGEAQASNLGSYTLNRGGVRYGPNGEVIAAPKIIEKFDDRYGVIDPLNPEAGAQFTNAREPTEAELLDRDKLALGAKQFGVTSGIAQQNADTTREVGLGNLGVARDGLSIRQDEAARKAAEIEKASGKQSGANQQTAAAMTTALESARRFVGASGVISRYNPLQIQDRANLEGYLTTLKGNITLGKLAEMKANSANGSSGMGALSDTEGERLASAVAALSVDMSPSELKKSFDEIDGYIAKLNDASGLQASQPVRVTSAAQARALPSGTVFIDPNGVRRRVP